MQMLQEKQRDYTKLNYITKGRFFQLQFFNSDHYLQNSLKLYKISHEMAVKQVVEGEQTPENLVKGL